MVLHNESAEFWFLMENTWFYKYLDGGPNLKGSHFNVVNDSCMFFLITIHRFSSCTKYPLVRKTKLMFITHLIHSRNNFISIYYKYIYFNQCLYYNKGKPCPLVRFLAIRKTDIKNSRSSGSTLNSNLFAGGWDIADDWLSLLICLCSPT